MKKLFFIVAVVAMFFISNTVSEEMKENDIAVPTISMEVSNVPKEWKKPLGLIVAAGVLLMVGNLSAKR